jgi:hypothetical protein
LKKIFWLVFWCLQLPFSHQTLHSNCEIGGFNGDASVGFGRLNKKLNFGVILQTRFLCLYRSGGLGSAGLHYLDSVLKDLHLLPPSTIIYMHQRGYKVSHPEDLKYQRQLANEKEIDSDEESGTYFSNEDFAAQELAQSNLDHFTFFDVSQGYPVFLPGKSPEGFSDIATVKFPTNSGFTSLGDPIIGNRDSFFEVLHLILTSPQPVLIHCKGGRHRTGTMSIILQNLSNTEGPFVPAFPHPWVTRATTPKAFKFFAPVTTLPELNYARFNSDNFRTENLLTARQIVDQPLFLCIQEGIREGINNQPSLGAQIWTSCYSQSHLWEAFFTQWDEVEGLAIQVNRGATHHLMTLNKRLDVMLNTPLPPTVSVSDQQNAQYLRTHLCKPLLLAIASLQATQNSYQDVPEFSNTMQAALKTLPTWCNTNVPANK